MVAKPPAPTEPGSELAQLQGLLILCLDLSKKVAKPDTEWVKELVQQIRTEFDPQRREQRKTLQQLIAGIKDLNLSNPTKGGRRPRAEREVPPPPILAKGRRVGAAQVPAHAHREPALASSQCGNNLKECKDASKRKANQAKRPR